MENKILTKSDIFKQFPDEENKQFRAKLFPLAELYETEAMFVNAMNNIKIDKYIRVGKKYMPEFFELHPQFEDVLRQAYSGYKNPFELPISEIKERKIPAAVDKLKIQMDSDDFKETLAKIKVASVNFDLINEFNAQLINKAKGDDYNIIEDLSENYDIASELIKPIQRCMRYNMLLNETKKLNKEINIDKLIEDIGNEATEIDTAKGNTEYAKTAILDIKCEVPVAKALNEFRQGIYTNINEKIKEIAEQHKSQKTDNLTAQKQGFNALIASIDGLKQKYGELKLNENVCSLSHEIKECIKEVKKDHPKFKVDKTVKGIIKSAKECDKQVFAELKGKKVIRNSVQLDTVKKLQLNLLDEIIKDLKSALENINEKIEKQSKNKTLSKDGKLSQKQKGLVELINTMEETRGKIETNNEVIYKDSDALDKKIISAVTEQKKETPLITKGFFSSTAKTLKNIEKKAKKMQTKNIDRALDNREFAQKINKDVNEHHKEMNRSAAPSA